MGWEGLPWGSGVVNAFGVYQALEDQAQAVRDSFAAALGALVALGMHPEKQVHPQKTLNPKP